MKVVIAVPPQKDSHPDRMPAKPRIPRIPLCLVIPAWLRHVQKCKFSLWPPDTAASIQSSPNPLRMIADQRMRSRPAASDGALRSEAGELLRQPNAAAPSSDSSHRPNRDERSPLEACTAR